MTEQEIRDRVIEAADEYHETAESQWDQAVEFEPTDDEEAIFEFRRLLRAALKYYCRSYLVLSLVETDDNQQFEELLALTAEREEQLAKFNSENDVSTILDEEGPGDYTKIFSTAEAIRAFLLQQSAQLAATLHKKFK